MNFTSEIPENNTYEIEVVLNEFFIFRVLR